jgi:hypothetical protein
MESQVAILDRDTWPNSRHQPLLADNFAGAFDKNDKNVERPSTQMNWAALLLKVSVRWKQAKWTDEIRSAAGASCSSVIYLLSTFSEEICIAAFICSQCWGGCANAPRPRIRPLPTLGLPNMFSILCRRRWTEMS